MPDYQFQIDPLTEEEEQYLKDHADMSNDDRLQDSIFVKHLYNTCVEIWQQANRILKSYKSGSWQYELAEKLLPDAEALCKNFVRK